MILVVLAVLFVSFVLAMLLYLKHVLDIDSIQKLEQILTDIKENKESHWLSKLFQVDEKSEHHGGELVAAVLKAHGIKEIFTLCGGHISPILVAVHKLGIRVYDTRHEVNAVFAADAVARLRQSVGVAVVTAGPGLTNTVTAVKNAQMAETAVVLIAGAAPTLLKDRGALQDVDQIALMRPLCKFVTRITRVKHIVPILKQAFCVAQSGTPGPVFVEIPVDILYPYKAVLREIKPIKEAKNLKQKVITTYLLAHISQQFGGDWLVNQDITPLPVTVTLPTNVDIKKLWNLFAKAAKPLLLIGSQAVLAPVSVHELKAAVEALGIPTYLGGMARGLLGHRSSIHMRHNRTGALREADLIILAGTVCDFRLSYGRVLSGHAKTVSINRNRAQMLKNEGIFWHADLAIQADVATTLVNLAECMKLNDHQHSASVQNWISNLRMKEDEKKLANIEKIKEDGIGYGINPIRALAVINKGLPNNAILVADGGDFVGTAAYIVHPRGPLQWLDPGAFGTLGVGAGFALGAKAVYPDRPVVILYGDGSCGFSLMEFDTFVRHKFGVVALIGNDACWSQIAREQISIFNSSIATGLRYARYDNIGAALGTQGVLVATDDELSKVRLEKVFASACNGTSTIVNIIIPKSKFREGSISI